MRTDLMKHFKPALYVVLGLLGLTNILALLAGQLLALLPLTVQIIVAATVQLSKPWSYIVVKSWALIVMVSGLAMWLAVFMGGPKRFHSVFHAVFNTTMLLVGFYFFKFAKPALRQIKASI